MLITGKKLALNAGAAQRQDRRTSFTPPYSVILRHELTDFSALALRQSFTQLAGLLRIAASSADAPVRLPMAPAAPGGTGRRSSLGVAVKRYRDLDPTFSADVKRVAEAEALYGKQNDPVETVELALAGPGPIQTRLRDLLQS